MLQVNKSNSPLVFLCASPGYGKTSLMVQCYNDYGKNGAQCSWLSIEAIDNDILRFMIALVESVRKSNDAFFDEVYQSLLQGVKPSIDIFTTRLLNELAESKGYNYIFVDDYHLISNPLIHNLIADLAFKSPQNTKWILSARYIPVDMYLGRLRSLNYLDELNEDDLRFNLEETNTLLDTTDYYLDKNDVALLQERTEGWVAGLQLASIALERQIDKKKWLEELSGDYRGIAYFLKEEVFIKIDEIARNYLLQTSILRRFNKDLCDYITKQEAEGTFNQIIDSHYFVFSLDDNDEWYRYHPLFSDFMNRRLKDDYPDRFVELHAKASEWYEDHAYYYDAIYHANCANNLERVAELLDHVSETLFSTGHVSTLLELAKPLPSKILHKKPRLMLDIAWQKILQWDFEEAKYLLNVVEKDIARHKKIHQESQDKQALLVKSGLVPKQLFYLEGKLLHRQVMLYGLSDNYAAAEAGCVKWLKSNYPSDPSKHIDSSLKILLQSIQSDKFQLSDTLSVANDVHETCVERNVIYGSIYHNVFVSLILKMQGDYDKSEALLDNAYHVAKSFHGDLSTVVITPAIMLANLHYQRNDLRKARSFIHSLRKDQKSGLVERIIGETICTARLLFIENKRSKAIDLLLEKIDFAKQNHFIRIESYLVHELIRIYSLEGDHDSALTVGRKYRLHGSSLDIKPPESSEVEKNTAQWMQALTWARLALIRNLQANAIKLLSTWFKFLKGQACWEPAMVTGVLLSSAAYQSNEFVLARSVLLECLHFPLTQHAPRIYIDEGKPILDVLNLIILDNDSLIDPLVRDQIKFLIQRFHEDRLQYYPNKETDHECHGTHELKEREVEILMLACDDFTNPEIAERLSISRNTVKWYWKNIFETLNVSRRGHAIKRAKELQIIK